MRSFFKMFIFCLTTVATSVALSKEGFYEMESLASKPALRNAAKSVFMVHFNDGDGDQQLGTAFLVKEDQEFYYFVTNDHVVINACRYPDQLCRGIRLLQNGLIVDDKLSEQSGPRFDEVTISKISRGADYAILRTSKIPQGQNFTEPPKPLMLAGAPLTAYQKIYVIGFPSVNSRGACPKTKLIHDKNRIRKRWSSGIFTGTFSYKFKDAREPHPVLTTTVDALGGNSGSPFLNESGEVVGILSRSRSTRGERCYVGNESPDDLQWSSMGIPWSNGILEDL